MSYHLRFKTTFFLTRTSRNQTGWNNHFDYVSPEDLLKWIETKKSFYLIDTLKDDHFQKAHLPGASNACVFEVTFLDQMKSITDDKNAAIVFYGSSDRSMDALTAAEKLHREGYQQIKNLKGGIESWRSLGYPLEGDSLDTAGDPETKLVLDDGKYHIDTDQSMIEWAGRNPNTKHFGTVSISSGQVNIENNNITGVIDIDINSIENFSLKGDELQPVLISHLNSDDFFFVKYFPTATLVINGGGLVEDPHLSSPNYEINSTLELRGVNADLSFSTTITKTDDDGLSAEAHFDIDRTRWNVIYGSTKFFEHLGMHMVFDLISFQVKIVAKK